MIKALGFDCANKSLAYTYMSVNTDIFDELNMFVDKLALEQINNYENLDKIQEILSSLLETIDNFIIIYTSGVIDLFPGKTVKETDLVFRTRALKKALANINNVAATMKHPISADTYVIIEKQPPTKNFKSSTVQDQIAMYYVDSNIILIESSLKNKVCFRADLTLANVTNEVLMVYANKHDIGIDQIPKEVKKRLKYKSNKLHTKKNLLHYCSVFGKNHILKGIKANNIDDLADSLIEIISYFYLQ